MLVPSIFIDFFALFEIFCLALQLALKVQPCKLYKNEYVIASVQTTNTEIFVCMAFLVFTILSRKILSKNSKDNRSC